MSVIELFPKKPSAIPEGETIEESMAYFYNKLDAVMGEFHKLNPMDKYAVMESLIEFNKTMTELYLNLRKDYKFNQEWYADLSDKLAKAVAKNKEYEEQNKRKLVLPPKYSNPANLTVEELDMLHYYKGAVEKLNTPTTPCVLVFGDTDMGSFEFREGQTGE